MSTKSSFGVAKPLPGQANYGMTETDLLDKQAREMEARLKGLQQRMQETAPIPAAGTEGTMWKSARPDKGSVTSYAKDVHEKIKSKKVSEKSVKATAEGRRMARKQSQAHFSEKAVDAWGVSDVAAWLESKNLSQYAPNFLQNEINGSVLMDISLEDLDYMGITILGHRKTILKGIEEIGSVKQLSAPSAAPARAAVSASVDFEAAQQSSRKPVHWSHAEPIANNKVSESEGATFVNPADQDIDEEAERKAFQDAVMEWRNIGKTVAKESSGLWSNPIGDGEAEEERGFNPRAAVSSGTEVIGGSLADGELDEEKERAEFAKAVAAWRNAGKTTSEGTGTSAAPAAQSVAEKLARSMEAEHEKVVALLMEEQEAARRKIVEAAIQLEQAKQRKLESEQKSKYDDEEAEVKLESKVDLPFVVHSTYDDSDSDRLSEASEENHAESKRENNGTVVVSLVESTLGFDIDLRAEEKGQYVVEEASDDEEIAGEQKM